MVTRREVLTGTAAASIAAIASARGIEAAGQGFDLGNLSGGALGAFYKQTDAFAVFLKFDGGGAEVFYKETRTGGVDVFQKVFFKGWSPVSTVFLKLADSLDGAEAGFNKIYPNGAEFFIKLNNGVEIKSTVEFASRVGVTVDILEIPPSD